MNALTKKAPTGEPQARNTGVSDAETRPSALSEVPVFTFGQGSVSRAPAAYPAARLVAPAAPARSEPLPQAMALAEQY